MPSPLDYMYELFSFRLFCDGTMRARNTTNPVGNNPVLFVSFYCQLWTHEVALSMHQYKVFLVTAMLALENKKHASFSKNRPQGRYKEIHSPDRFRRNIGLSLGRSAFLPVISSLFK